MENYLQCLPDCGACCIAPEITSSIPGMPKGKPAGVVCVQLDKNNRCKLFGKPERPKVCIEFLPGEEICGKGRDNALQVLTVLEVSTNPESKKE